MMLADIDAMDRIKLRMSNCDHSIDTGLAEALKEQPNKSVAKYDGWNFCGYVWFDGSQFVCQVWTYNCPREDIKADTLEAIMCDVSSEYGDE